MKVLKLLRNVWAFLGAAAPIIDQARVLFPEARRLGDIDAKLDRLLGQSSRLAELRTEIETELTQSDVGPRTRELLQRVRQGLALLP